MAVLTGSLSHFTSKREEGRRGRGRRKREGGGRGEEEERKRKGEKGSEVGEWREEKDEGAT